MWKKIFIRNKKQAVWGKCAKRLTLPILLIWGICVLLEGWGLCEESVPGRNSEQAVTFSRTEFLDRSARLILEDSIQRLSQSQSYSVDLFCQVKIHGASFTGKGMFCQKRLANTLTGSEIFSARWEMEYYLPGFRQYQLSVLNGEQMKLWTLRERRPSDPQGEVLFADMEEVDLKEVSEAVTANPEAYPTLKAPWFTQPRVDLLLQGILESCRFTMAGETQIEGTDRKIYQIQGFLKPELVERIIALRQVPVPTPPKASGPASSIEQVLMASLPAEVPTHVELFVDQAQGVPFLVRFLRPASEAGPEFSFTISFENTYLNNATLNASFFEVAPGNVTRDATGTFLQSHRTIN